jgi:hypothetical protein
MSSQPELAKERPIPHEADGHIDDPTHEDSEKVDLVEW